MYAVKAAEGGVYDTVTALAQGRKNCPEIGS